MKVLIQSVEKIQLPETKPETRFPGPCGWENFSNDLKGQKIKNKKCKFHKKNC